MRKIISVCLAVIISLSLISCGNKGGTATSDFVNNTGVNPMYDQLNEDGKKAYDRIVADVADGKTEYVFKNVDVDTVTKGYLAVVADHPEFFWINEGYSCSTKTLGNEVTITFTSKCNITAGEIEGKNSALNSVVGEIVSQAEALSDDYSKIKFVHDYIVNATVYDEESFRIMVGGSTDQPLDATTAYGCLVNKKAVCSGYAAAFQLCMQRLGVSCGRIAGHKIGGESHEWNYLLLGDEYYFIDVTWDDPVLEDKSKSALTYEYFLIDEAELLLTHTINPDQTYPACNGKSQNYYKVNGLFLETYSFDSVKNIILEKGLTDGIEIKFASEQERQKAIKELFEESKIFEIPGFENGVSYSLGSSGLVLSVFAK